MRGHTIDPLAWILAFAMMGASEKCKNDNDERGDDAIEENDMHGGLNAAMKNFGVLLARLQQLQVLVLFVESHAENTCYGTATQRTELDGSGKLVLVSKK